MIYGLLQGENVLESCHLGMAAARQSLSVSSAIHPQLRPQRLMQEARKCTVS